MKTIQEIKNEIRELERTPQGELKSAEFKKILTKIDNLKTLVKYLETNPCEKFIEKEIERLKNRITKTQVGFVSQWEPDTKYYKKERANYLKEMGVPKLRQQLQSLLFLKN
jgi:hypothetical protein